MRLKLVIALYVLSIIILFASCSTMYYTFFSRATDVNYHHLLQTSYVHHCLFAFLFFFWGTGTHNLKEMEEISWKSIQVTSIQAIFEILQFRKAVLTMNLSVHHCLASETIYRAASAGQSRALHYD